MADRICAKPGCGRTGKLTRGLCGRCYRYWLDHTPPAERGVAPRFSRDFWDYVKKTHDRGCWVWAGSKIRKGYGYWSGGGSRGLAHRHSWALQNGPIPDGLWVLHHCDNPPCVNPAHLYLGTVVENVQDAVSRNRLHRPPAKTHCLNGHELAGDNLRIVNTSAEGPRRMCRTCDNARSRERQRTRRAAKSKEIVPRTHCANGHELTEENVCWRRAASDVVRRCRTCEQNRARRYRERRLTAASVDYREERAS